MFTNNKKSDLMLGYWNTRGVGAPLRMLCEYAGIVYQDHQYDQSKSSQGLTEWFGQDREEMRKMNAMASLPYIKDHDVCMVHPVPCIEYLGEKFGLDGKNVTQQRMNKQLLWEMHDLRGVCDDLLYPHKGVCETKDEFIKLIKDHLESGYQEFYDKLETTYASHGGPFSCGRNVCAADFFIWEMLDQHEVIAKTYEVQSPLGRVGEGQEKVYKKLGASYAAFRRISQLQPYFIREDSAYKFPCNPCVTHTHKDC